jgi:hypothetical protein
MAKFVSSSGKVIHYIFEKDHLVIEGTMHMWNWDTSFKKAVLELKQKQL